VSELGDWLAENVMGWQTCRRCTTPHYLDADGEWVPEYTSWDPEHVDVQAMQVLDKMIELGWDCITLSFCRCAQPAGDSWVLSLAKGSLPFVEGEGSDTRAEAICAATRAAIEAERAARPHRCTRMASFAYWERVSAKEGSPWRYMVELCEGADADSVVDSAYHCHLCGAELE